MPFVPAKCPQCGANIEVDNTHDAGICKYCGTPFVTEKVIQNYNTYITNNNNFNGASINIQAGDFQNFLNLANKSLDAREGEEALKYANKALELDSKSPEAWIAKMLSMELIATFKDDKANETIEYGKNAIVYASDDKKETIENTVYTHYLKRAQSLFSIINGRVRDTAAIKDALTQLRWNAPAGASQRINAADSSTVNTLNKLNGSALLLKISVPTEKIMENSEYQKLVLELCNQCVRYINGLQDRYAIYSANFSEDARKAHKAELIMLETGLTPEDSKSIPNFEAASTNTSSGGCYIATCVYGSYDCPQVWTLRRFRDNILDESWYGRLFIKCYYATSPSLVKWFGNTVWFKRLWKCSLDALIKKLHQKGVPDTFYHDKY